MMHIIKFALTFVFQILLVYALSNRVAIADEVSDLSSYQVQEITSGNYVHVGNFPPQDTHNHGDVANIGFIVGSKCVAVIDTGSSIHVGSLLKDAIHKVTSLPICVVVITHVHPDHLLGLNAFAEDLTVTVYGHHRLPKQIRKRSKYYLEMLQRDLAVEDIGSHAIDPSRITTVDSFLTIDLGDRVIEIQAWDYAHTDHDVTVTDVSTGTFWAGDLVFSKHVPILDSNARQYDQVLKKLQSLDVKHYVVGHGPLDRPWRDLVTEQRRYLDVLMSGVRTAIDTGVSLMDAVNTVGWDEHDRWLNFELYHRRNVTTTYTDLEWED
jgi:quinoprotein relay system zinc metallohydrolase 2